MSWKLKEEFEDIKRIIRMEEGQATQWPREQEQIIIGKALHIQLMIQ